MAGRFSGLFKLAAWRRWWGKGRLVALVLLAALFALRAQDPALMQVARAKVFDFYQQLRPQPPMEGSPVVIVDLDEDSLAAYGQWPWPRTLVAEMVQRLIDSGAVVVAYDIVFAEPDRMSPASVAQTLPVLDEQTRQKLTTLPSNDQILGQVMRTGNVVVGQAALPGEAGPPRELKAATIAELGNDPRPWLTTYERILTNVPAINEAAAGWAVFTVAPEPDGVVRRVPAIMNVNGTLFPALSLEALRQAMGKLSMGVRTGQFGVEGVLLQKHLVQTDANGRIYLYAGRHDPNRFISAGDVLSGKADPARIAGRIVLIGTSAAALQDIRSTAVEAHIPGVELHAQIIETIMNNTQLKVPVDAIAVELTTMIAAGLAMIVLLPAIGARWTLVMFVVMVGGVTAFSWHSFVNERTLYDPVYPALGTLLIYMYLTYAGFTSEEAQKRQVRGAFSRYMSPALVEKLAQDPGQLKLGGEMRDMTLLFCDVRGFTTISELFDAEGLTRLINRFLTPMTNVILDRKGTIDKYMGDCIMAFWNAPLDDPDHAANACRSALAMNEALKPLNDRLEQEAAQEGRRHVPIAIGIGLNSGVCCVGNMGSDQRFDYSVLGDNVNLASRLEGQSKNYGVMIVIGENTQSRAPGFATLELDLIKVKGKTEAVRIFTLQGDEAFAKSPEFLALKAEHDQMLAAYRGQRWDECEAHLARCRQLDPGLHLDGLWNLYAERVEHCRQSPPGANWDGVFVATSK